MSNAVAFETMSYTVADNGVATITIDVKDRSMNVLTPALHQDVARVAGRLKNDTSAIGAVLRSGKPSFMAGGDLKRIVGFYDQKRSVEEAYLQSSTFTESLRALETCGKPIAVMINGTALGGGLELALACHYRVVLNDPKIKLGLPETTLGLMPGAGGTQRLPRLIGLEKAADLILNGTSVSPQQALDLGVVQAVADPEELFSTAENWVIKEGDAVQPWDKRGFSVPGGIALTSPKVSRLLQQLTADVSASTNRNYPAPIAALRAIFKGCNMGSIDGALKVETREFSRLTRDSVARNMIRTLFLSKGAASSLSVRPDNVKKSKVTSVAVLLDDASNHDVEFVILCGLSGVSVNILCRDLSVKPDLLKQVSDELARRVTCGAMIEAKAASIQAHISQSNRSAEILIIKSGMTKHEVSELIEVPAIIAVCDPFSGLDTYASQSFAEDAIIGFSLTLFADNSNVIELIAGSNTSMTTLAHSLDFAKQLRLTPTLQYGNSRLFSECCRQAYMEEGFRMLKEGVSPILIENGGTAAGFPLGPLALADDFSLPMVQAMTAVKKSDSMTVIGRLSSDLKRHGKDFGAGFYEYDEDGSQRLWSKLTDNYPENETQPDVNTVKIRLLSIQALTAISFVEKGMMSNEHADLVSVFCADYPAYTGGAISYVDSLGVSEFISQCALLADKFGSQFSHSDWLLDRPNNRIYQS